MFLFFDKLLEIWRSKTPTQILSWGQDGSHRTFKLKNIENIEKKIMN
jgi:hypothetical protein